MGITFLTMGTYVNFIFHPITSETTKKALAHIPLPTGARISVDMELLLSQSCHTHAGRREQHEEAGDLAPVLIPPAG